MSLGAGDQIGPYTITAKIGEGGMGEVYRARDSKLERDVALKILPSAFAHDSDRLARFEREARTLAALNHANIAQIFGFEQAGGTSALVMELVDGDDLSQRIQRGPLAVDDALDIAKQIAAALEAAHEAGVVHRDLKPANIKVRADGTVKLLDFGLAKALEGDGFSHRRSSAEAEASALQTITSPAMTQRGVILGTAAYMSPEQARGLAVDKRTDIWAFGVVLFEMLSGRRAFNGGTVTDTLASVLTLEPDWPVMPATTPARVVELIRRCLRKDPKRRLRDIGDAVVELDDATTAGASSVVVAQAAQPSRSTFRWVPWTVALVAVLAGVAAWVTRAPSQPPRARAIVRVNLALPSSATMFMGRGSSVAISPDGTRVAFTATDKNRSQLYVRALDQSESTPLPGTDGAANPFFSPDGQWVGFSAEGKLKKINLQGRTVVTVADAPNIRGEAWGRGDMIYFTPTNASALWKVPAGGGKAEPYTTLGAGEMSHRWPQVSASGNVVVFTVWNDIGFEGGRIAVQRVDGRDRKILVQGGGYGRIVETGDGRSFLVYAQSDGLFAAPLDLDRLELTGAVTPVVDAVFANLSGGAHYSFSNDGHLAYLPGSVAEASRSLVSVDRAGKETVVGELPDLSMLMDISRDGRVLVGLNSQGPNRDVFVHDLEKRSSRRLTNGGFHGRPRLTPDGQRVVYTHGLPNLNLYWRSLDGSGDEERLTTSANAQLPGSVSPDGKTLTYAEFDPVNTSDIWSVSLDRDRTARPLIQTRFSEGSPDISPDGRWLAYQSNETGRFEIYVTSFPTPGDRVRVTAGGGVRPNWSGSGREIYYRSDTRFMSVPVTLGAEMHAGEARMLFSGNYLPEGGFARGKDEHFLIPDNGQIAAGNTINLVLNWFDDLTARLATR